MLSFELKYVHGRGEYIVCTLIQYVLEYLQKIIYKAMYISLFHTAIYELMFKVE